MQVHTVVVDVEADCRCPDDLVLESFDAEERSTTLDRVNLNSVQDYGSLGTRLMEKIWASDGVRYEIVCSGCGHLYAEGVPLRAGPVHGGRPAPPEGDGRV